MNDPTQGNLLMAMVWMALLSLALFWLPFFGPLIAGLVGGKTAGGVLRGLLAAILPAVLLGVLLFALSTTLTGLPLIGLLAGGGVALLVIFQGLPLILGALLGGLLAKN